MQKTWAELLGTDTTNCEVDGNRIVSRVGAECRILWAFDDKRQALDCFAKWKEQVAASKLVLGDPSRRAKDANSVGDPSTFGHYSGLPRGHRK